jgi:hypothetical protein
MDASKESSLNLTMPADSELPENCKTERQGGH